MSVTDAGQWTNNERTLKIELLGQQWKLDAVFRNEKINFFYNLSSICCEFESAGKIFVFKVKVIVQKPSEHHRGNIGEHWHRTTREWKGFLSLPSHMAMINIPIAKALHACFRISFKDHKSWSRLTSIWFSKTCVRTSNRRIAEIQYSKQTSLYILLRFSNWKISERISGATQISDICKTEIDLSIAIHGVLYEFSL